MNLRRTLLIAVPFAWLLIFFAVPFFVAVKISLSQSATAIPPYLPSFDLSEGWAAFRAALSQLSFENYRFLSTDSLYIDAYVSSLGVALRTTVVCLALAYPIAYAVAKASPRAQIALVLLLIMPMWTSFLVRIYAWIGILSNEGLLNHLLMWLGVVDTPLRILNTPFAVYLGIVYAYMPFMIFPIYASLQKLDVSLTEAAQDLGCSRIKAFWLITVPLSMPGVIAGCFLIFIPAIGEYVIPTLLGGASTLMIGQVLFDEFFSNRDWPVAAAVAVLLLLILVVPIVLFQRNQEHQREKEMAT